MPKPKRPAAPRPPAGPPVPGTAPPPPVPNAPLPVDPGYDATQAGLARQRDVTYTGLEQQRQGAYLQYGYKQDANGQITFDATNPYSQAAMAKRQYDQQRAGNTNSMAARGQLYSGALTNAQNATSMQEGQTNDTLQKQFASFLARTEAAKAQAGVDYEMGMAGALGTRVQNAASSPLYDPVTPPVPAPPPKAKAKPKTEIDPAMKARVKARMLRDRKAGR
jgi:hypothetical protein